MTVEVAIEDKKFHDLNPLIFGREHCKQGHSYGPACRNYYLIHYVFSGCGTFYSEGMEYHVNPGEIFLIKPHQISKYTADQQTPWYYTWIGFDGNLAEQFSTLKVPVMKIRENIFKEMSYVEHFESTKNEFLASRLFLLYSEIFEQKKNINYIEKVTNYINSNYMNSISIDEIAKMVNLERHYLSRIFKQKVGITMQEYLIQKRMNEAIFLLKRGCLVSETARMVGYDDVFVFSKAFKRIYRTAPSYFINQKASE